MTKYNVKFTRHAIDGYEEQVFNIPVEALDPSAAALIAGTAILLDSMANTSIGAMLSMMGIDLGDLADVTMDAYKDCVNVSVTSV